MQNYQNLLNLYFSALSELNAEKCASVFAPDAIHNDPVIAPANNGRNAIYKHFREIFKLFSELKIFHDEIYFAGNTASLQWHISAKGKNGKNINFSGIDIFEFNNQGQLKSLKGYWDPAIIAKLQN